MSAFTQSARTTPAKIARFIRKHVYTSLFVALMWVTYFVLRYCVALVLSDIPLIEYLAKSTLHQPVRIQHAEIKWHGYKPEVILENVQVLDDNEAVVIMQAKKIHVGLRVLSSLYHERLMESFVDVSDTTLSIKELPDHHYELLGFKIGSTDTQSGVSLDILINFVSANEHINLNNVRVNLYSDANQKISFILRSLHVANKDKHHTIQSTIDLPFANSHATFLGHFDGELSNGRDWHGKYEFKTDDVHITSWFQQFILHDVDITDGDLDVDVKGLVKSGKTVSAQVKLNMDNFKLHSLIGNKIYNVEKVSGVFDWVALSKGWRVTAHNLMMRFNSKNYRLSQISNTVEYGPDSKRKNTIEMAAFNVNGLVQFAQENNLLSQNTIDVIHKINFDGNIKDVAITLYDENFHLVDWDIAGTIEHANIIDIPNVPQIKNLTGRFDLSYSKKSMLLNSKNISVTYPNNNVDYTFDKAVGKLTFDQFTNGWQIAFDHLELDKNDQKLILHGIHQHYTQGDTDSDIQVNASGNNIAHFYTEIKPYIQNKKLQNWFQIALVDSQHYDLELAYKGKGADFPYGSNALSTLHLNVKGATLNYDQDFPAASQIDGSVDIKNKVLAGTFTHGQIGDLILKNVNISIPDLSEKNKHLMIAGNMNVTLPTDWQFLYDSKIGQHFDMLKKFNLKGHVNSILTLDIPLFSGGQVGAKGEIDLGLNEFTLQGLNVTLNNVVGKIFFDKNHIVAKGLNANFYNLPVNMSIESFGDPGASAYTKLNIDGLVDNNGLKQMVDVDFPLLARIHGETHYHAALMLSHQPNGQHQVDISSNLVGMKVDLPGELGKNKEQPAPLHVHANFGDNARTRFSIAYRNNVHANVVMNKEGDAQKIYGATIVLGQTKNPSIVSPGLNVFGVVDEFDLMKISDYLGYRQIFSSQNPDDSSTALAIHQVDLRIKHFYLSSLLIQNVQLMHDDRMGPLSWKLAGQDVNGRITLPSDSSQQWLIALNRANFHSSNHRLPNQHIKSLSQFDLRTFPAIGLSIDDLAFNDKSLGRLTLNLQADGDSVSMQNFSVVNSWMNLNASGRLTQNNHMELRGDVGFSAIQNLFSYADLPVLFTANRAGGSFNVFWDVSPQNIGLRNMNGTVSFFANDGELSQISNDAHDNMNYIRLVNALSVEPLAQGRFLAFSDLDRMAMSYDEMTGTADFSNGVAHLDPFTLESSYMDLALVGDLDFAHQSYNMQMKVNPYIFGSIPAVALAAGGPAAGGVALAANALMHKTLMNAVSYYFSITGPWNSPKIIPRQ